jgi:hypothetical protein
MQNNNKHENNSFFGIGNVVVILVAVAVAVIGFYQLHIGGVSGSEALYVSPILLCLAYLVLVPLGILLPSKKSKGD